MLLSSVACQGPQAAQDLGSSISCTCAQSKISLKPAQNQSSPAPHWQVPAYSHGEGIMMLPWESPPASGNLWLSHFLIQGGVFVLRVPKRHFSSLNLSNPLF